MADSETDHLLDVRELDEPPFDAIMEAVAALDADGTLLLVNEFEPVPLYSVLEDRGYAYDTERIEGDEWRIRIRHA